MYVAPSRHGQVGGGCPAYIPGGMSTFVGRVAGAGGDVEDAGEGGLGAGGGGVGAHGGGDGGCDGSTAVAGSLSTVEEGSG